MVILVRIENLRRFVLRLSFRWRTVAEWRYFQVIPLSRVIERKYLNIAPFRHLPPPACLIGRPLESPCTLWKESGALNLSACSGSYTRSKLSSHLWARSLMTFLPEPLGNTVLRPLRTGSSSLTLRPDGNSKTYGNLLSLNSTE